MTSNQIAYWKLQEEKRANQAKESETKRSNLVSEAETQRHNQAEEAHKTDTLMETFRSNVANEREKHYATNASFISSIGSSAISAGGRVLSSAIKGSSKSKISGIPGTGYYTLQKILGPMDASEAVKTVSSVLGLLG